MTPVHEQRVTLSVIVIGRNESARIDQCLRAVLAAVRDISGTEIIYVDSASTDDTVVKASRYPVTILQLRPWWQITSAAGRYIGYRNAGGDYLLFVDGDTVVYKRWPAAAIRFLEEHPDAGGVAGILHEMFLDAAGGKVAFKKNRYGQKPHTAPVTTFGGTAMYRRTAMEKAGSFNPWVRATPELEAALRIRRQGYRLYRIFAQMAITYAPQRESVREVLRRANSNLYAVGNTYRYCLREGTGRRYVRERMDFIILFAAIAGVYAASAAVFLVTGTGLPFLILTALALAAGCVYGIRRKSLYQVLLSLIKRSVILYSTVISYATLPVYDPETYPLDAVVIKRQGKGRTVN
ncbi:glycosyltransferase [bacterium]|nr:glycosyltransferase [bacterium]